MYAVPVRCIPKCRPILCVAALASSPCGAAPLAAQSPTPDTSASVVAPYRLPLIALVQPATGEAVPQDRPVAVFRFAPGDPADPLDLRSFRVAIDGDDRTPLFTVAAQEAWGPMAPAAADDSTADIEIGAHEVVARICSARGACAAVTTAVTVTAAPSDSVSQPAKPAADRRRRVLELVLDAAKRLLVGP